MTNRDRELQTVEAVANAARAVLEANAVECTNYVALGDTLAKRLQQQCGLVENTAFPLSRVAGMLAQAAVELNSRIQRKTPPGAFPFRVQHKGTSGIWRDWHTDFATLADAKPVALHLRDEGYGVRIRVEACDNEWYAIERALWLPGTEAAE